MDRKHSEDGNKNRILSQKQTYEAPRVLSRETLEGVAALCTPSPPAKGNPGACPSGPISS